MSQKPLFFRISRMSMSLKASSLAITAGGSEASSFLSMPQ